MREKILNFFLINLLYNLKNINKNIDEKKFKLILLKTNFSNLKNKDK